MWLFEQLEGPVYVDGWEERSDCTVVEIPSDCIGYITGNRRSTLGVMEEEWGTLMFFMNKVEDKGRGRSTSAEKLAIFGPRRGRRGSELKVMSGVETKSPGFFTRGLREKTSSKLGFDTDRLLFGDDELSYSLGKEGSTRKKLELTSGAVLQYVGHVGFIAGTREERARCREYIGWLLAQRRGTVTLASVSKRTDCLEVAIPGNCKGWVTGNRGSELRRVENETGTYMFMALDGRGEERLLIFGVDPGSPGCPKGRLAAERQIRAMIREKLDDNDEAVSRRRRARSESHSRSRSPPVRLRSPPLPIRGRERRDISRSRSPPRLRLTESRFAASRS